MADFEGSACPEISSKCRLATPVARGDGQLFLLLSPVEGAPAHPSTSWFGLKALLAKSVHPEAGGVQVHGLHEFLDVLGDDVALQVEAVARRSCLRGSPSVRSPGWT